MADDACETIPLGEAANRLGVSQSTALRMVKAGTFPGLLPRVSRHYKVRLSVFEDYLAKATQPDPSDRAASA